MTAGAQHADRSAAHAGGMDETPTATDPCAAPPAGRTWPPRALIAAAIVTVALGVGAGAAIGHSGSDGDGGRPGPPGGFGGRAPGAQQGQRMQPPTGQLPQFDGRDGQPDGGFGGNPGFPGPGQGQDGPDDDSTAT